MQAWKPPSFLWEINLDFNVCENASSGTQKHLIHENKENGIPFWKCFHMASEAHKNMFFYLGFLRKNSYKITTFLSSDIYREVIVDFHIPCRSFDWLKKARVNWVSREPRMASKRVPHTICKNGKREGICNTSATIWKSDNIIISKEV